MIQQEPSSLAGLACASGQVRELSSQAPLLLGEPARCLVVLEGTIDLFLVETTDGMPSGIRHHVLGAGAGELLFGIDGAAALSPVALLAVGQTGTRVAEVDVSVLQGWGEDPAYRPLLLKPVEKWVTALSHGAARLIRPRPRMDVVLSPGEDCDLVAHARLGCGRTVAWIDTGEATPFLLDTEEVDGAHPQILLPLAAGAWLSLAHETRVRSVSTAEALADGRAWPAVARLHGAMLDILPMNLRLAGADEVNRLRSRGEADARAATSAVLQLAGALAKPHGGHHAAAEEEPLVGAVSAVLRAMGHSLVLPGRRREDDGEEQWSLEEILRANRLRGRRLRLDQRWWTTEAGPFLLLREADGVPLAILPRGASGGYDVYDAVSGTTVPLSGEAAAALRGLGHSFYAPLPLRALRGLDIMAAVLNWSRAELKAILLCGIAGGLLSLAPPIATDIIVNDVIPSREAERLVGLSLALVLMALCLFGLQYAVQVASVRIEGLAGPRLQAAIMDRILRLPVRFFRDYTAGDLTKRVLAIESMQATIGGRVVAFLLAAVIALFSLALMFWFSWPLALISLIPLLIFGSAAVLLGLLRIRYEAALMATTGRSAGLLLQLSSAIAKLRLAAAENRAFLQWARLHAQVARETYRAARIEDIAATVQAIGLPFATAVIFAAVYGLDLAPSESGRGLPLGMLLAFLAAFSQTLAGMTEMVLSAVQLATIKPLYSFAAPILQAVPEVDEGKADPGELSGAIELSGVTMRYAPGAPPVFQNLSLAVAPGEYVAVVGASGAGKSTLLRLLLGFETAEAGMVLYDGQDLRGLDVQWVRRQMGVVLQSGKLMTGSLLDNILGPFLGLPEEDAWWAAEQVGLAADIRQMPMGMNTVVTDAGGALSGGQVQRLLLARAIVARPRILLLDEATSALDNRAQAVVTASLARLNATRVVIAHRLSTVMQADRIVVLQDGRVQEYGRFEELMAGGTALRDLAARQLL